MKKVSQFLIIGFLFFASSCEKENITPQENILSPQTFIVEEDMNDKVISVTPEEVRLDGTDDRMSKLKEGEIIVSGINNAAPMGFMRKVIEVKNENGVIILRTENARFDEIFEKCDINFEYNITEDDFIRSSGINISLDDIALGDKIKIGGELNFSPKIIFKLQKNSLFDVKNFELGFSANIENRVKVNYEPEGSELLSNEWEVLSKELKPIIFYVPVGPIIVPVIIFVELDIDVGFEFNGPSITGVYSAGGDYYNTMYYENGVFEHKKENTISMRDGTISAEAEVLSSRIYVKPEIEFQFYDYDGIEPLIYSELFGEFTVAPPDCELKVGLGIGIGAEIDFLEFFGIDDEVSVSHEFTIASRDILGCNDIDFRDTLILNSPWEMTKSIEENGSNTLSLCNSILLDFYTTDELNKYGDCEFDSCKFFIEEDSNGDEVLIIEESGVKYEYSYEFDDDTQTVTLTGVGNQACHIFKPKI